MCPSYMVTREEEHSTRGRARLLFEMLDGTARGGAIADGWRSDGGARRARPVPGLQGLQGRLPGQRRHGHLQGRVPVPPLRRPAAPRPHYSMGWLPLVAAARRAPARARSTRWRTRPGSAALAKAVGGIDQRRDIPVFARADVPALVRRPRPDRRRARAARWCCGRTPSPTTSTRASARAAVEVLEAAGWRVRVPDRPVCCGLTWISTGQLGIAKRVLRAHRGRAAPVPARRRPGGRAGAELHGGVPQPTPPSCSRHDDDVARLRRADRHPRRAAARPHARAGSRRRIPAHAPDPDPLPPPRDPGLRRRPGASCRRPACDADVPRLRLLRAGRELRLRAGPLRGVRGVRRAGAAARRAATPPRPT